MVERTGERHWEAELYRLQAGMLDTLGDDVEAEARLFKALEVARWQHANTVATLSPRFPPRQSPLERASVVREKVSQWTVSIAHCPEIEHE